MKKNNDAGWRHGYAGGRKELNGRKGGAWRTKKKVGRPTCPAS